MSWHYPNYFFRSKELVVFFKYYAVPRVYLRRVNYPPSSPKNFNDKPFPHTGPSTGKGSVHIL